MTKPVACRKGENVNKKPVTIAEIERMLFSQEPEQCVTKIVQCDKTMSTVVTALRHATGLVIEGHISILP